MSWLVLTLLALLCFVVYEITGRFLATKSSDPRVFASIYNSFVVVMSPLLFLFDPTLPHDLSIGILLTTVVGLIVWGLFGRFEYFARRHTEASVFTITIKLFLVINFFLAVFIFRETLTLAKISGISLIVVSSIILFLSREKDSTINIKGLKYTILVSVLLAFGWIFDALNVKLWGVATFGIISFVAPAIASSIFPIVKMNEIKKELSLSPWWHISLLGFFNLAGYGLMLKALTLGPASSVIPITNSASPFVIIFGYFLLGENKFLGQKTIACLLILVAIYLMR